VRDRATKAIFEQKDSRKIWDIADAGWRNVLRQHRGDTIARWIATLNTPKSDQVDTLFVELLGISRLSDHWHWQSMSSQQAREKLDLYITIRGTLHKYTGKRWGFYSERAVFIQVLERRGQL
jgi:hypothetical protein